MSADWTDKLRLGAVLLGACALSAWLATEQPERDGSPDKSDQLNRLLQQRYNTAKSLLDLEEKRLNQGVTTLARVCDAARWVKDSALELPVSRKERLAVLTNYVGLTRRLDESLKRAVETGAASASDGESARYLRLDAEIVLLRTQLQE